MVLIEAISLVIRRSAIDAKYRGGWEAFARALPNATMCTDGELVRVGFMAPEDVKGYIQSLTTNGLTFVAGREAVDCAVVDQYRGATTEVDWLEVRKAPLGGGTVTVCALKGSLATQVATPRGWRYEGSLSQTAGFVPGNHADKSLEYLRTEAGLEQAG